MVVDGTRITEQNQGHLLQAKREWGGSEDVKGEDAETGEEKERLRKSWTAGVTEGMRSLRREETGAGSTG